MSQSYRSPSPSFDTTAEEVPPLAFESEQQLVEVLARLRTGLQDKVRNKLSKAGKEVDRQKAEDLVLKNFYDSVAPLVCSNCTIRGRPYALYIAEKAAGTSQEFDEKLHQKVIQYQEEVFELRTKNVNMRKEVPQSTAKGVENILEIDLKRLAQVEDATNVPPAEVDEEAELARKNRSSQAEGPTPAEAEANFTQGSEYLSTMLKDIPLLSSKAERAAQVSKDASELL